MNSIWTKTAKIPEFPQLAGDRKTDVLVIGGGIAGILCAYFLQKAGVPYVLVESGNIGSGITKNTTAKITAQHGLIYQKLLKDMGAERAIQYLQANRQAVETYGKLCADMDCDFVWKDAYVYSLQDWYAIEKEFLALQRLGFPAGLTDKTPLPFPIAGAVQFPKQAQFHPLKFLVEIAKGLNIYANTHVRELGPGTAVTAHGKITAKAMVVCTHFPFLNKHGGYFLKMYQHRSYAIALQGAPDIAGMYLEEKKDGFSFRNHRDMLIIGGGDHKTGKKGGNWQVLREFAAKEYPHAREIAFWATQDCMTLDGVPYIGQYGKSTKGLYVATGFNKWGMTSSMVAAQILTDALLGKKNAYAPVFSPQRSMQKPRLLINGMAAVGNLLTPTAPRCPHMGCALKWNPIERSYDCPCHGSRFSQSGALLDNPATGGLHGQL